MFAIFLSLILTHSSVHAEEPGKGEHKGHGPCREDVQKLCKGIQPGGGAIIKCMKEHEAELSAECKANVQKRREEHAGGEGKGNGHFKQAHQACKGDVEKFCKGIQPGGGAIVKCMKEHSAELSAECKAAAPKRQ